MSSIFTPLSFHPSSHDLVLTLDTELFNDSRKYAIICDTSTLQNCLPKIAESKLVQQAEIIEIEPGEASKAIEIAIQIWETLLEHQFQKNDFVISLGGGVVCDIGGFVAATFKRGMRFCHIPTSYLAMVDASVGGKQGVNLGGAKNQVGVIQPQEKTYICPEFLETLPKRELISGFAESIKHGLIADASIWYDAIENIQGLSSLINLKKSLEVKQNIVNEDPFEKGVRKKLNFGHTIGHAIEASNNGRILHGEAIAWGMAIEAFISHKKIGFDFQNFQILVTLVKGNYEKPNFEMEAILRLCNHDKKNNQESSINFTLIESIGAAIIDQQLTPLEVKDFLEEFLENYG